MQELPEDLKQELESLGEGKQYTVEEEDGTTTTYIKPIVMPRCEEHYFEPDGMQGEYQCVKCKCGNGRILPKDLTIKEGKIVPIGRLNK